MTSTILNAVVSDPVSFSKTPSEAKDKRHHRKDKPGFMNPWPSWQEQSAFQILGKILMARLGIRGKWNSPDTTPPTVPVHKPEFLPTRQTERLRATWLGHACYYVEFPGGLRVLFDPVFTCRCSPFSFLGPKRYTEMPCKISDMPFIDAVVISHSHYDHLSHPTVLEIKEKFKNVHFFVPLGNKQWFEKLGIANCTEMDWWEEKTLSMSSQGSAKTVEDGADKSTEAPSVGGLTATIGCLPCQHTSGRTPFDRARTLWSSWSISSGGKKIWFGGDTGYRAVPELPETEWDYGEKYSHLPHCPAFADIGNLRGPFDLGLIPIGAYDPRWIMSPMHANPYDSVNIFADTKCERALGMHWGTWVLTTEEVLEPPKVLKEALKWKGLSEDGVFEVIDIGASKEY